MGVVDPDGTDGVALPDGVLLALPDGEALRDELGAADGLAEGVEVPLADADGVGVGVTLGVGVVVGVGVGSAAWAPVNDVPDSLRGLPPVYVETG